MAVAIFAVGFALTASAVWGTKQIDDSTERRLLERQTEQAATVLSSAIVVNQQPLETALALQSAAGTVDGALFRRSMSASVGPNKTFVSASIWQREGDRMVRYATLGAPPAMRVSAPSTQAYLKSSLSKAGFSVTAVRSGSQRRIAIALADPDSGHVVYAERSLPADGRSRADSDSAFAEINYAIYLGAKSRRVALATDVNPKALPFTGTTAEERVPYGDTVLTLVTKSRGHLGASLSQQLPLILLVAGLFLTAMAFVLSRLLVQQRQTAEESAAFAVGLSERLQRALLPLAIPQVPQLEVAVKYVAGARGVDIGGDWYSFIALDSDRFAFVVGDVSGKGIDAVAVMARARFTLRAYLLRGDSPDVALSMSAPQFDVIEDGHIVTTVLGVGNWRTGEITVANAGHCKPLLLGGLVPRFLDIATGPPLGAGPFTYASTTFSMNPGEVMFCYTDGLIERRNEGIDTGMDRLSAAAAAESGSVADLVEHSVETMRSQQAEDDIAVLAFRWTPGAADAAQKPGLQRDRGTVSGTGSIRR